MSSLWDSVVGGIDNLVTPGLAKAKQGAASAQTTLAQTVQRGTQQGLDASQKALLAKNQAFIDNAKNLYNPLNLAANGYVAPAKAANFDVGGNFAGAYKTAQANTNPLYEKYLNQFLEQQTLQKQAQQHTFDVTNTNLDTALKQTQEANATTQERTGQDVALNEADIANKQDQFQTDSGTQNTADRLALAKDNSASGLTGGLGAQKLETQAAQHGTVEARTGEASQQKTDAQELFKARTFEDLATSNKQAGEKTTSGKANAQFDLDNYLALAKNAEDQYRTKSAADEQQAILEEQQRIAKNNFESYLTTLSDPVRAATAAKYAGSF